MPEFLITFREALEASLIVGIIYTFLAKSGQQRMIRWLWGAVVLAILASIVVAIVFGYVDQLLASTAYHALFEAVLMFVTAGILLYTIRRLAKGEYHVRKHGIDTATQQAGCLTCQIHPQHSSLKARNTSSIKQTLIQATTQAVQSPYTHRGVFSLVFFAILREGFETVLLLQASSTMLGNFSHRGFWLGILTAIVLGYAVVVRGKRVHIRRFFAVTSVALVFFAAGMVAYGVHETEEFLVDTGYLTASQVPRVWDILRPQKTLTDANTARLRTRNDAKQTHYHLLHDKGSIGVIAKGLLGYNSNPNPIELLMWLLVIVLGWRIVQGTKNV